MTYKIGDIIYEEDFTEAAIWCDENNATMEEIEPDEKGRRFQIVAIPKHIPTWEEIDIARQRYREQTIDPRTNARTRKTANGTWTEKDEQDYLALDAEVTAWIEENLPYPEES